MRILFSSTRGAGHFTPLVPYIEACLRHGHEVAVAGPDDIASAAARSGAGFRPFDHPGDELLRPLWNRLTSASRDEANAIVIGEIFAGLDARASVAKLGQTFVEWRPDVVVRETSEFGAAVLGDKYRVPQVRVATGLSAIEELNLRFARAPIDDLRQELGLARAGDAGWLRVSPYFTVVPQSLEDPASPDQPSTFRFREPRVGPGVEPLPAWWPSQDRPLVYVTFGSVAGSMPLAQAAYRAALDAVADLPVRVLLTIGRGADSGALDPVPGNVHVEEWVPHYQVLEQADAVVCHGGSGTVLGTLAAGKPLVVVPLFADQPHNAARVARTGAGMCVELGGGPSVLREAIVRTLEDENLRRGAAVLAAEIAAQAPIEAAVAELEKIATKAEILA